VTTPGGTATSSNAFTVIPAPTVTSIIPASGAVGTSVAILGTNLTGSTRVSFAGAQASFAVDSATKITAKVPAGAASGTISVTTAGGTAISSGIFTVTVTPKPSLSRLSPTAAKRGVTVTLTGKNFGAKRSTSYVKFGTTKVTKCVSWSNTRIKCKVPAKAKFGKLKITVVTAGGTSSARTFTVKR
jgi:hypothetical protein